MHTVTELPQRVKHIEHLEIPVSDGTRLAARLWLPENAEQQPVPALLEYIPYRKRDLTRTRDSITHPYLAGHGYACLRLDIRGSGESEGVLADQYRLQEQHDGIDVIRWLAQQPWCSGRVGMMGISWGGFNALQIAALSPEELKAIITVCSTDDLYLDNMHYMGGCLLTDNLSEATTMFSINTCPPDPELVGDRWRDMWLQRLRGSGLWLDTWLRHQRRDDYWRHGSVCEDYASIQCPVMAVGGWADGYTNAIFRLLEHLKVPRQGLIGPWGHRYPHMGIPGPAIGFLQEALRWFDHWLKDHPTGIMQEPMLRAWMLESVPPTTYYDQRPGYWVGEQQWPSPRIETRRCALAPHQLLWSDQSPASDDEVITIQSPLSVGLFAGKWCSYSAAPDLPHDQREEDGGSLVFESPPLEEEVQILGSPQLEVELASNRPTAMIAVRLSDVATDDKAERVTYGLLNLTHRNGHEYPQSLQPGHRYRIRVSLNHVARIFPVGHRIRLSVSTSYWPLAWAPPQPVRLSIYPHASALHLPIRPPQASDSALEFLLPEGAAPEEPLQIEPVHHNWLVHRDLAADVSTQEVIKDEGLIRLPNLNLQVGSDTRDRYSYQNDDFTSLRAETQTERVFRRRDWSVRTTTKTVLTADLDNFYVHAQLDAWEDEQRIYSENWQRTIERDHV